MKYEQLPLPMDCRMLREEWEAHGFAVLVCPGCAEEVSYPANTHMYACVCGCGWFTEVDDRNAIWWFPPYVAGLAYARRVDNDNLRN